MNEEKETWDEIVRFNDQYFPKWRSSELVRLSNALAGEIGELCNSVKHLSGGGTNEVKVTNFDLMDELSDVFVYLVLTSEVVGFPREYFYESVKRKMRVNIERMEQRTGKKFSLIEPRLDMGAKVVDLTG